jgi:uncharacterized protein YndB with AHSA1/START domain
MNYGTYLDAGTVRHERLLPGPLERVWMYLTESAGLSTWLGHATIPPRAGDAFTLTFVHCGEPGHEEYAMHGETRIYQPQTLLEYLWREDGREEVVRFELTPVGDRVRLVLTHTGLDAANAAKVGPGWHAHLDVLDARLVDGPEFPFFERYDALKPGYEARLAALPERAAR